MPSMTLPDVPTELHAWIEQQARAHGRSVDSEAVDLLDRQRRLAHGRGRRLGIDEILGIGRRVARAPALDERSPDEILGYDKDGLPG
jgi:plasmid stability protein